MGNYMSNGIVLTVNLQGRLGERKSNSSSRNMQRRILASPYEYGVSKNGKPTGNYITPKGHFSAPNNFVPMEEQKCVRKTNISGEVIDGWISNKAPFFIKDFIWKNMSKPQRLKAWVERFDEGFGVTYQEL